MRWVLRIGAALLVAVALVASAFWFVFRPMAGGPIPQGFGYERVPAYAGAPAKARRLESFAIPPHPFMAATNANSMHGNAFSSGTHARGGPLGFRPQVRSIATARFGGECATVTFDSRGRIVAVCAGFGKFMVALLDADTLEMLAHFDLPSRESNRSGNIRKIMSDTSGGAYFFLDHQDRAVLVDAENRLRVIGQRRVGTRTVFEEQASFDLNPVLARESDKVTAVLPDWQGRYWFVSRLGMIGNVDPESGAIAALQLPGEEIQNSHAIGPDGVYVVSDHAMYRIGAGPGNQPVVEWRESYDRGSGKKVGSVSQGSGTTPSLMDDRFVVITDDADAQVHLLVLRREIEPDGPRLVCRVPLFEPGASATDNSVIVVGNSIIAENNHGYDIFPTMMFGRTATGGVVRIDVADDESGCREVWYSSEISQTTVPKVSLSQGLVYLYTKHPDAPFGVDAYYLTALDFGTGATLWDVLTGTGVSWDNNWAPITLGDDGTAYVGTYRGLAMIRDQPGAR